MLIGMQTRADLFVWIGLEVEGEGEEGAIGEPRCVCVCVI